MAEYLFGMQQKMVSFFSAASCKKAPFLVHPKQYLVHLILSGLYMLIHKDFTTC
jgi:hypothetical protein